MAGVGTLPAAASKPKSARRKRGRRGIGSIEPPRLPGGPWRVRIRIGGRRQRRRSLVRTAPTFEKAVELLAKLNEARFDRDVLGIDPTPGAVTLAEFLREHHLPVLHADHAASTLVSELVRFQMASAFFGTQPLCEITTAAIRDYVTYLRSERPRTGMRKDGSAPKPLRPASQSTVHRHLTGLSVLFKHAIERGFARENPVRGIKRKPEARRPVEYLSARDFGRMLPSLAAGHRPVAAFLFETGCRRGEAAALGWAEVDLAEGVVVIATSKNGQGRRVVLTPEARRVLAALHQSLGPVPARGPHVVFPALTASGNGSRWIGADRLTEAVPRAAKHAGIRFRVRCHDLRHAAGSALMASGASLVTIARLLGHKAPSALVTWRYVDSAPEGDDVRAIRRLAVRRAKEAGRKDYLEAAVQAATKPHPASPAAGAVDVVPVPPAVRAPRLSRAVATPVAKPEGR